VRKEGRSRVQEAEIIRRGKGSGHHPKDAEAQRRKIETLADAERQRLTLEATGRADAQKTEGAAAADVIRLKGTAEAEIIRAKGQSEAAAMQLKASAFLEYNEAAVLDKLFTGLPEVVRAFAEPLSKVDKITVVSTGGEPTAGVNKITADMSQMVAQVPALLEALTGKNMSELLEHVRKLGPSKGLPSAAPIEPADTTKRK
jgi:flotillin